MSQQEEHWALNYFNYFTEIEEHFQKARGTSLFLLSPLDWALIEGWKKAGIPLEAVLRGIDAAFEKWRQRKTKTRMVNSLTYCTQAVMDEAEAMAGVEERRPAQEVAPPFTIDELREHLERGRLAILDRGDEQFRTVADSVGKILSELETHYENLEELEQRLTACEEKLATIARLRQTEDQLFEARRDLARQLKPYRGKMSTEQLAMLERQYLDRRLLESADLPRLSLFYLR